MAVSSGGFGGFRRDIRLAWLFARSGEGVGAGRARPFLRIAMAAVCISTAVVLISFAVARGFQHEVARRVLVFASDYQLLNLDRNASYQQRPISGAQPFLSGLRALPGVARVNGFGLIAGIIKTRDQMHGAVLKGVDRAEALTPFGRYLLRGRMPEVGLADSVSPEEVAISQRLCDLLLLDTGKRLTMYFAQEPPRARRFRVVGVYETQVDQFDGTYVLCDLSHVRTLNGWDSDQVGGFEIGARESAARSNLGEQIEELAAFNLQSDGTLLRVESAYDRYRSIFDWLSLLDTNVVILLTLMLCVASVNMITALLILILDRGSEIGLLRSLGATVSQIRTIFILRASRILLWGLLLGNALAGGLLLIQWRWHLLTLDPREYHIDHVPVEISAWTWVILNAGVLGLTCLSLVLPSRQVSRVSPSETLRFS